MKRFRSMVLVSGDTLSLQSGAHQVFQRLQEEIKTSGLADEIDVRMIPDLGRHDAVPLVVVYPEAGVYGPVKP